MNRFSLSALIASVVVSSVTQADANPGDTDQQTKVNYQLHCQGCHTHDGSGHEGRNIPTLTNYMGKFLKVEGGREFLIQVPGAAQSLLDDQRLAELTNWMIRNFDPISTKIGFAPYTAEEVAALRKIKVLDFTGTREALVAKIEQQEADQNLK